MLSLSKHRAQGERSVNDYHFERSNHLRELQISVLRSLRDLEALQSDWQSLVECCPRATPFQTWEWISNWARHAHQGELHILAAHCEGELVALLPLSLERTAGLIRRLRFLGAPISDYHELIALPEWETVACQQFFQFLVEKDDWDLLDLTDVRATSPLATLPLGLRSFEHRQCPAIVLDGNFTAFSQTLSKRMRSNLKYGDRLLRKNFAVEFDLVSPGEIDSALEDLFYLHNARWQSRHLGGAFSDAKVRQFHRAVAPAFAARGWLRLHRLRLDGKTRALFYCFAGRESVYYYLSGFDLNLSRYGLGTQLMAEAVRAAAQDGAKHFDLLRGDENYKVAWNAVPQTTVRLCADRNHLRGLMGRTLVLVERSAERIGSRLRNRLWGHRRGARKSERRRQLTADSLQFRIHS